MQAPPGPSGPQLSPDGNYWWDGARWVAFVRPQAVAQWQTPSAYRAAAPLSPPAPPGIRPFLLVFLGLADVITVLMAVAGLLALLDYVGWPGPYDGPPVDPLTFALIGYFELVAAITILATVTVATRLGPWARVTAIAAGALICMSCVGVVLGGPIVYGAIRAPMTPVA
jgi:hypothetical protein